VGEGEYFSGIPQMQLPEQMVNLAEHIVDKMLADFDPALLEDRYRTVLASKLSEKKLEVPERAGATAPSHANVVNLMDILQRSLRAEEPQKLQRRDALRRAVAASKSSQTKRGEET
jgi:DNA end-binding protein Ku